MRGVLLIPCVGPMQSWGTRSRFQERDTEREPTKSGVTGMLCAALGRDRSMPVDDLAALKMGVRVDREGIQAKDYQTAQDVLVASMDKLEDMISTRYYLSDAAFLVGLEGPLALLEAIHAALKKPVWPLFLGRKSYVPSDPLYLKDGLAPGVSLREALTGRPLMLSEGELKRRLKGVETGNGGRVRLVFEADAPTHEVRSDQPVSFALGQRVFRQRFVVTEYVDIAGFPAVKEGADVSDAVDA